MSMTLKKAKEATNFLKACNIKAAFEDEFEQSILVYDREDCFLLSIDTDEEWEELKTIAVKIAGGLAMRDLGLGTSQDAPE